MMMPINLTIKKDCHDPAYRRLRYSQYADVFWWRFIGPKCEVEVIKIQIGLFLNQSLHLELHEAKTLIPSVYADYDLSFYSISLSKSARVALSSSSNDRLAIRIAMELLPQD
jgi:hypothetical protein